MATPRSTSGASAVPLTVVYRAYDRDHLQGILSSRLAQTPDVLDPAALKMCASKVASTTGDARTALDFVRKAIKARLQQMRDEHAAVAADREGQDAMEVEGRAGKAAEAEAEVAVPLIKMKEMRTVLGSTTDRKLKEAVEQLPLQAQILLCVAGESGISKGLPQSIPPQATPWPRHGHAMATPWPRHGLTMLRNSLLPSTPQQLEVAT